MKKGLTCLAIGSLLGVVIGNAITKAYYIDRDKRAAALAERVKKQKSFCEDNFSNVKEDCRKMSSDLIHDIDKILEEKKRKEKDEKQSKR